MSYKGRIILSADRLTRGLARYQENQTEIKRILNLDELPAEQIAQYSVAQLKSETRAVSPIGVTIQRTIKVPFDFPPYLKRGDIAGLVMTPRNDKTVLALVPKNEFDSYHNNFPRSFGKGNSVLASMEGYVIDAAEINQRQVYIVSTKQAYRVMTKPQLLQLMQTKYRPSETAPRYIEGTITGFEQYGAIVRWQNLDLLLTNSAFNKQQEQFSRHRIPIKMILEPGEKIPIVFDRLRKNKRIINVLPLVEFPNLRYNCVYEPDSFQIHQYYWAKILEVEHNVIQLQLGLRPNEHANNHLNVSPIRLFANHPLSNALDAKCVVDNVALVEIIDRKKDNFVGNVIDVTADVISDYRKTYLSAVADFRAKESES